MVDQSVQFETLRIPDGVFAVDSVDFIRPLPSAHTECKAKESAPPRLTPWIRKRWIALSRFGVRSCPKHLGMLMKIMALFCSSV